ncbi:hypothetical protein [Mycoavidus sp. B2-EB]|uniref:hypothetical protein n=1 Tax=Mycoavidus sp. B2-EB TaxID=2651972 RepID=UPI00162AC514|nr:hypothetical protein [Mycoavidus sp. B2-EB]
MKKLGYQVAPLEDAIQAFNQHYLGRKHEDKKEGKLELDAEGKLTLHRLLALKVGNHNNIAFSKLFAA